MPRRRLFLALAVVALLLAIPIALLLPPKPPPRPPLVQTPDLVLVLKGQRRLLLLRDGQILRDYKVALGFTPTGDKQREGDGRTPEGRYVIDWRNPDSRYHLSLHISYPDKTDIAEAKARGAPPGGDIMIHGLPNGLGWVGANHLARDWTAGCVAVTNEEIEEIWHAVPDGTAVEIRP